MQIGTTRDISCLSAVFQFQSQPGARDPPSKSSPKIFCWVIVICDFIPPTLISPLTILTLRPKDILKRVLCTPKDAIKIADV